MAGAPGSGQPSANFLASLPMIRAAHWLRDKWTKPQPLGTTDRFDPAVPEAALQRWLANKKIIELPAAGFEQPISCASHRPVTSNDVRYHPFWRSDQLGVGVRTRYGYTLRENLWTQGKLGSDVLWLADMQQNKHQNLYVDLWHYNAAFSQEIAGRICEFLGEREKSILPGAVARPVAEKSKLDLNQSSSR